jgi:hypothetical protein
VESALIPRRDIQRAHGIVPAAEESGEVDADGVGGDVPPLSGAVLAFVEMGGVVVLALAILEGLEPVGEQLR